MKIVISADMEGTTGVVEWIHVSRRTTPTPHGSSAAEYGWARLTMTREVNAALEGAMAAGADQVIVNESHDGMRNLLPEELHKDALLINGAHKQLSMVQGVDEPGRRRHYLHWLSRQGRARPMECLPTPTPGSCRTCA